MGSFVFPTKNMGNHVVLFGLLVLALIGLGLASNEPNLEDNIENEPNNVNEYTDLFGPYSTVFSDYLASLRNGEDQDIPSKRVLPYIVHKRMPYVVHKRMPYVVHKRNLGMMGNDMDEE